MFGGLGPGELVIILVIALVVLGPKRLPEAGRALGKGLREFKDSVSAVDPRPEIDGDHAARAAARQADARGDEAP